MDMIINLGICGFFCSLLYLLFLKKRQQSRRPGWLLLGGSIYVTLAASVIAGNRYEPPLVQFLDVIGATAFVTLVTCIPLSFRVARRKGSYKAIFVTGIVSAALMFTAELLEPSVKSSSGQAQTGTARSEKRPEYLYYKPGLHAYLEDMSRNRDQQGTILDDYPNLESDMREKFIGLRDGPHHDYPQGTEIRILGTKLFPTLMDGTSTLMIKVEALSGARSVGYAIPADLIPVVPRGTRLLLGAQDKKPQGISLDRSITTSTKNFESRIYALPVGYVATVELVSEDLSQATNSFFKVRVLNGKKRGLVGYESGLELCAPVTAGSWATYNAEHHCTDLSLQFAPGDPNEPTARQLGTGH